jgi:hypothetical protein
VPRPLTTTTERLEPLWRVLESRAGHVWCRLIHRPADADLGEVGDGAVERFSNKTSGR